MIPDLQMKVENTGMGWMGAIIKELQKSMC